MASQLPLAQPKSILRGHHAQVHTASFVRGNQRLASGDAEGYVVLWDLAIMRPRAVWRAHTNAILGIASWGADKIITHGRDNQLIVWKVGADDEVSLSTTLPLDPSPLPRPQPWILHILEVNTMNFCSFGSCPALTDGTVEEVLVAVPNTLASESVDIYQLPSQNRLHTVHPTDQANKNGMAMALALFHQEASLTIVTAYENGLSVVVQQDDHDVSAGRDYFITSGADAVLVKHPIPRRAAPVQNKPVDIKTQPLNTINTKHSGQQSLRIRSDDKIFATAGWDSKIRVYSAKTMQELAVLKWHQAGCYAVAFAQLNLSLPPETEAEIGKEAENVATSVVPRIFELTVKERRIKLANEVHWLAAGSKDGKISLWDIY